MDLSKSKIAILGAGNLGIAIALGIVDEKLKPAKEVFLTRRNTDHLSHLAKKGFQISSDNADVVKDCHVVMLCVQPKQLPALIDEINPVLTQKHVLVSVITGVSIDEIKKLLKIDIPVVRAMPNTAIKG